MVHRVTATDPQKAAHSSALPWQCSITFKEEDTLFLPSAHPSSFIVACGKAKKLGSHCLLAALKNNGFIMEFSNKKINLAVQPIRITKNFTKVSPQQSTQIPECGKSQTLSGLIF